MEKRILYYSCKLYSSDLLKNEDYKDLKVVGILVLVNHNFKDNEIYKEYIYKSKDDNKIFSDDLDIRIFNLKYASIDNSDNIKNKIAKFITSNDRNQLDMLAGNDEILKEISEKIKIYNSNRREYQIMTLWDEKFESEERTKERYIKAGRDDGLEQGRKEGIKVVATNLLKNNASIDLIIKSTGLSEKEISKIAVNT